MKPALVIFMPSSLALLLLVILAPTRSEMKYALLGYGVLALAVFASLMPAARAAECGWLLWERTSYVRPTGSDPDDGYRDRWAAIEGYDTALDCHAVARAKADTTAKIINGSSAKATPVGFVISNRCFPVGFDPRVTLK